MDFRATSTLRFLFLLCLLLYACMGDDPARAPEGPGDAAYDKKNAPPAPESLTVAVGPSGETVSLAWKAVKASDLSGYLVYRNDDSIAVPALRKRLTGTGLAFEDTLLNDYYSPLERALVYRVKAIDNDANSSAVFSNAATARTTLPLHMLLSTNPYVTQGDTGFIEGGVRSGNGFASLKIWVAAVGAGRVQADSIAMILKAPPAGKREWSFERDAVARFAVAKGALPGRYSVYAQAQAGGADRIDSAEFSVIVGWDDIGRFNAGAQGNATQGTAIDIDSGKVMTSALAVMNQTAIDLDFLFVDKAFHLMSPFAAKKTGLAFLQAYQDSLIADTRFARVDPARALEAPETAFAQATLQDDFAIQAGEGYLFKRKAGVFTLLTVTSIAGTDGAGSMEFALRRTR